LHNNVFVANLYRRKQSHVRRSSRKVSNAVVKQENVHLLTANFRRENLVEHILVTDKSLRISSVFVFSYNVRQHKLCETAAR